LTVAAAIDGKSNFGTFSTAKRRSKPLKMVGQEGFELSTSGDDPFIYAGQFSAESKM
jgi:hypothetical protein